MFLCWTSVKNLLFFRWHSTLGNSFVAVAPHTGVSAHCHTSSVPLGCHPQRAAVRADRRARCRDSLYDRKNARTLFLCVVFVGGPTTNERRANGSKKAAQSNRASIHNTKISRALPEILHRVCTPFIRPGRRKRSPSASSCSHLGA